MTLSHGVAGALIALALAAPVQTWAQQAPQVVLSADSLAAPAVPRSPAPALPPLIVLTPEATLPAATAQDAAQATAPKGLAPLIDLVPPGVTAPLLDPSGLDAPQAGVTLASVPPGTLPAAIVQAPGEWLMPMIPVAGSAPTGGRIGAGMTQPGILRLSGEIAEAQMTVTLPEDTPTDLTLTVALRSSVNNLPEKSNIIVMVNDVQAGTIPLDSIGPFVEHKMAVTGLIAGANRIRLIARQSHRIFCGPEASFGIWTEIDLGKSGIPVSPLLLPLAPSGLMAALQAQTAGGGAIEVLADADTDRRLIRMVARQLSDSLGYVPRLTVVPFYAPQMDQTAKARIAIMKAAQPQVSIRRGAGDATVLQIEYAGDAVPDLSLFLPVQQTAVEIPPLTPGVKATLASLGAPQIIGNTHYFRRDVSFVLPDDWLLLASQKAVFEINYGFSEGLPEGGLLLIKVNGQTVRLLPLDREGGKILPPLRISFRANRLHAGLNTLTFEMAVPGDPAVMPCAGRDTDMLAVLGDSTLFVPASPKMHQSDMARSLAGLDGFDVTIHSTAAGAAQWQAASLDFEMQFRPLVRGPHRPSLHIVGMDDVGLIPLGKTGLTRRDLQTALDPLPLPDLIQVELPKPEAPTFRLSAEELGAEAAGVDTGQAHSFLGKLASTFTPGGWAAVRADAAFRAAVPGSVSLRSWLGRHQGQAILLQLDPDTPDDLWLLTGPDMTLTDLAPKLDAFRRDASHATPAQAAVLGRDGKWVTWSQNRAPRMLESLSFGNLRTALGNYASWSPLLFTSLSLLFALLSVFPAIVFVLVTRRAGSRT